MPEKLNGRPYDISVHTASEKPFDMIGPFGQLVAFQFEGVPM